MTTFTGGTLLEEVGTLEYNTVIFSVLYRTELNGVVQPDEADWTKRGTEYTLTAEGIVASEVGLNLEDNFPDLRILLSQYGGTLTYTRRGFGPLVVNPTGGGGLRDMAWGPKPKVLHFQPLGNGLSAYIRWQCTFFIPEVFGAGAEGKTPGVGTSPIVQYSYKTQLGYSDDFYSNVTLTGVLEVPLTRSSPNSGGRVIPQNIVDSFRQGWENIQFDLSRFRITHRDFNVSNDLRTCHWVYRVEELPPMLLPNGAPKATGSFDVQPMTGRGGSSLAFGNRWSCTLRATYFVRKDFPRRTAGFEFYLLMMQRMNSDRFGVWPTGLENEGAQTPRDQSTDRAIIEGLNAANPFAALGLRFRLQTQQQTTTPAGGTTSRAMLTSYHVHEGLYDDSKSCTFTAQWLIFTTFRSIMNATGIWRWPEDGVGGTIGANLPSNYARNTWAISMQDISGWKSWLANRINPQAHGIVDFGGAAGGSSNPVTQ